MAKKHKKRLAALSISGALLLTGVSAYALHELNKINASEFARSKVILNGHEISLQDFYENVSFKGNQWVYTDSAGKNHRLNRITDFNQENITRARRWDPRLRRTIVDTVYYTKVVNDRWNVKADSVILYQTGAKSSTINIPTIGYFSSIMMETHITHFVSKDAQKDPYIESYNDEYYCTSAHEDQHFENATPWNSAEQKNSEATLSGEPEQDYDVVYSFGVGQPGEDYDVTFTSNIGQIGQSYELTYDEMCLDEISANIKQLMIQRRNYLEKGKDLRYISREFRFYSDGIKEGIINPTDPNKLSKKEKEFIANGIFDYWMARKYDNYGSDNLGRTVATHSTTHSNYNSVLEDLPRHERVVRHISKILGIDFSPHFFEREHEILERITPEQQKIFDEEVQKKKEAQEGRHLDELEYTRMTKGQKAYEDEIERNVRVAKANKFIANFKNFFGNQK